MIPEMFARFFLSCLLVLHWPGCLVLFWSINFQCGGPAFLEVRSNRNWPRKVVVYDLRVVKDDGDHGCCCWWWWWWMWCKSNIGAPSNEFGIGSDCIKIEVAMQRRFHASRSGSESAVHIAAPIDLFRQKYLYKKCKQLSTNCNYLQYRLKSSQPTAFAHYHSNGS